jgi:phage gp29-like protein
VAIRIPTNPKALHLITKDEKQMNLESLIEDRRNSLLSADRIEMEKKTRFNPLENWTPEVLVRQLVAYARGEISALSWVMEWLETHDEVIQTVAPKAKAAVSRHGYDILLKQKIPAGLQGLAEDQQGKAREFFQSVEVGDALELEEVGGMRLLFQQIMDAYGKRYAAHHIIWRPGRTLSAEIVKVPTWFFEVKTGRMRFLPSTRVTDGISLDELGGRGAWMISKGRGVMLAGCIARMFKQIPLQDWLTYCDRHGMPAFLGKTKAKKGTPEWNEMSTAIRSIGSEFGAVVNVDDVIDVMDLKGTGELPYEKLVDRMDRAQVMLWRGGDLSTISRNSAVGSNPQSGEAALFDSDNAEWVSETLNRQLTSRVISYYFGENAPALVELKLRTKIRDNVAQDLEVLKKFNSMGERTSAAWASRKFGVVLATSEERAIGEANPNTASPQ